MSLVYPKEELHTTCDCIQYMHPCIFVVASDDDYKLDVIGCSWSLLVFKLSNKDPMIAFSCSFKILKICRRDYLVTFSILGNMVWT